MLCNIHNITTNWKCHLGIVQPVMGTLSPTYSVRDWILNTSIVSSIQWNDMIHLVKNIGIARNIQKIIWKLAMPFNNYTLSDMKTHIYSFNSHIGLELLLFTMQPLPTKSTSLIHTTAFGRYFLCSHAPLLPWRLPRWSRIFSLLRSPLFAIKPH